MQDTSDDAKWLRKAKQGAYLLVSVDTPPHKHHGMDKMGQQFPLSPLFNTTHRDREISHPRRHKCEFSALLNVANLCAGIAALAWRGRQ